MGDACNWGLMEADPKVGGGGGGGGGGGSKVVKRSVICSLFIVPEDVVSVFHCS